jgi:hypothetical protein
MFVIFILITIALFILFLPLIIVISIILSFFALIDGIFEFFQK